MLSIILPCYNEGKKLQNSVSKIVNHLNEIPINEFEIIIVNDGSKDNTIDKIIDVKEIYPTIVKLVHYKDNHGKGYAVKRGILEAKGDIVIFMDVDLSTDLSAINSCLNIMNSSETYDIIIGSRRLKESQLTKPQGFLRKLIGTGCKIYTNLKLKLKISDTQCGFKCFKGDIAKQIVSKQTIEKWAFDAELLYIAKLNNFTIKEIPVIWENDEDSKVSPMKASIDFIFDLGKMKKNKKNYII